MTGPRERNAAVDAQRLEHAVADDEPVVEHRHAGLLDRQQLAVAIRTFTIAGGRTYLGVGGGIVADSRAEVEWAETELKAARLLHAAGASESAPVEVR